MSSPCWRGDSPRCRNLSSPSAPCQGCRFYPASSPLHFPFFFFCPMWLYRDLSCAFGYLRSSASSQQVVCENYSICRCLLGAFMWRDALLSSRRTPSPPWTVCYMQGIVHDTWDPTVIQADNDAHPCGPWVKVWGEVGDLH